MPPPRSDAPRTYTVSDALERAAAGPGTVWLAGSKGDDRPLPWSALRTRALAFAAGLTERGVAPGERLLMILGNGEPWLVAYLGCLLHGALPAAVSPPQGLGTRQAFVRRLGELAQVVEARGAIVSEDVREAAAAALPGALLLLDPAELGQADPAAAPRRQIEPQDPGHLQFTSGTTSRSRAALLTHEALVRNADQIGSATRIGPGSTVVSWLPLFHDMGLVGGFLSALWAGVDLVLATPFSFLRRPASWLEAIHRRRGTHSPAPTFAYKFVADRVRPRELEGLDLSSWRVAYVGAESIPAGVLEGFQTLLAPRGLGRGTLLPCYGLAEATVAVTFNGLDQPWRAVEVSRRALAATPREVRPPSDPADAQRVVSCGRPLDETAVEVRDPQGTPLPDDQVGAVWIRGPQLMRGYWGLPAAEQPLDPQGWLDTGDLGFLRAGELFLVGRGKEVIILRGENHAPSEIEWSAEQVPGVRRAAAFGLSSEREATEVLALLVEVDREADREQVPGEIRRRVHEDVGLTVAELELVASGSLPLTTSGKLQRAAAREAFLALRAGRSGP